MVIDLLEHNRQTYKRVQALWKQTKEVAVVQATGTGKSYLIASILNDFKKDRKLIIAPSKYILHQLRDKFGFNDAHTLYFTYSKLYRLNQKEIKELKPKLIVLDEYHRAGAEEWGKGVNNILKQYPKAYKFGTTATPIRHLDDARDMSKELFRSNLANDMNLAQAIAKGILPAPKYVSALYTLENIVDDFTHKIAGSKRYKGNKQILYTKLNEIKLDFQKSRGIPIILKKHLNKSYKKLVIFLKNYKHLLQMEPEIKNWFLQSGVFESVNTYRVVTAEPHREQSFQAFKEHKTGKEIDLLLSVDMFNEGLHIPGVDGVILLRETESPNIFYQQIGRCLITTYENRPVIFDFVNNFKSVHADDFLKDLEYQRSQEFNNKYYEESGIEPPLFTVIDETREINALFGEIKFSLDVWEQKLELLKQFKKEHGHLNVHYKHPELGHYLSKLRQNYKIGLLNVTQIDVLNKLGIDWNPRENQWLNMYGQLKEYKEKFGNCFPPKKYPYIELNKWCQHYRTVVHRKTLNSEQIELLNKISFEWSKYEIWFESKMKELVAFKHENNHLNISRTHPNLGNFITILRKKYINSELTKDIVNYLNDIGFDWDNASKKGEKKWMDMYKQLCDYKNLYGNTRPLNIEPFKELSKWCFYIRNTNGRKHITAAHKVLLDNIDFEWSLKDTWFEKKLTELKEFKKINGHLNIPFGSKLSTFTARMRQLNNKGLINKDKFEELNKIGFDWNPTETKWQQMYQQLCDYKKHFGHTRPPSKEPFNQLNAWVEKFRTPEGYNILSEAHKELLDEIDFEWIQLLDNQFEEKFTKLVEFKKVYGHLNIPLKWQNEKGIKGFIARLRSEKEKVKVEQRKRLEELGFEFSPAKTLWDKRIKEFEEYKKKYKTSQISSTHKEYEVLYKWLIYWRKRKYKLSKEQVKQLEDMGFEWVSVRDKAWLKRFEELQKYKKQYKTTEIKGSKNIGLLKWLKSQKQIIDQGNLSPWKITKLNNIGALNKS